MAEKEYLYFKNRKELRNWFIKNHMKKNSFELIFYKKHTNTECIEYSDAVEEALCFGWIDSMIKRLDEDKYSQHFSKRNKRSHWSKLNIIRMNNMIKKGRAVPQGIEIFRMAEQNGLFQKDFDKNDNIGIPQILIDKLKQDKKAEQFFLTLYTKEKQAYSHFISDAKKDVTRKKRLNETIVKLKEGWRMPYFRPENGHSK